MASSAFSQNTPAIAQTITDGVTTSAPSQNAVFDALTLKQDVLDIGATGSDLIGSETANDANTILGTPPSGYSLLRVPITGIDMKTAGATGGASTADGESRFVPVSVQIECTEATSISIAGAFSVGTNAASYNDILAISTATGVVGLNKVLSISLSAAVGSIAPNTQVFCNITTPATGTSQTVNVYVMGYYAVPG